MYTTVLSRDGAILYSGNDLKIAEKIAIAAEVYECAKDYHAVVTPFFNERATKCAKRGMELAEENLKMLIRLAEKGEDLDPWWDHPLLQWTIL